MSLTKFQTRLMCMALTAICAIYLGLGCGGNIPPQVINTSSMPQARMSIGSSGLIISSRSLDSPSIVPVQSQSFDSWDEFVKFAEATLGAKRIYDDQGRTIAVTGEYTRAGEILFRDPQGNIFKQSDFISTYLGGNEGILRIGDRLINLEYANNDSSIALFNLSEENCNGSDCISGESWLKHIGPYHSVGSITRQTSGGFGTVPYQCCSSSGTLVTINGKKQCQLRKPGAWRYDRELGRLIPTSPEPYVYADPRICSRQSFNNQLRVNMKLIFGPNNFLNFEKMEENIRELEISQWLLTFLSFDLGPEYLDEVIGVCGFHASTRGGSVRTSDGWTGDNGILCTQSID